MIKDESSLLLARVEDLAARASKGVIAFTDFLSPREVRFLEINVKTMGISDKCVFFGGYDEAERKRAFFLPDYIDSSVSYEELCQYIDSEPICAVLIRGSGYKKLTHRDYLGSMLGLGLERSVLGDIVFCEGDEDSAVAICDGVISDFLLSALERIGSDKVKVTKYDLRESLVPKRNFSHISDTVASARIDCVVSSLCSLSREKASAAIRSGLCELEYELIDQPDKNVSPPCIISVRGYGKFKVNSLSERTKKGRLRLDADKYL